MDKDKKRARHLSIPQQQDEVDNLEVKEVYYVTPSPDTVVVQQQPIRSKDACCWGW